MSRPFQILLTIAAALLAMLLPACASEDSTLSRRLDKAEALMETSPDSALSILKTIDVDNLASDKDIADYNLILYTARYMAGENDTLPGDIAKSVEYYENKSDYSREAKASRIEGIIHMNRKEPGKALFSFIRAESVVSLTDDSHLSGLIFRNIAESFEMMSDWKSALDYNIKSYNCFRRNSPDNYTTFAMIDIARCQYTLKQTDSSLKWARAALERGKKTNSLDVRRNAFRLIGVNRIDLYDYSGARDTLELIQAEGNTLTPEEYMYLCLAYIGTGEIDKAEQYNEKLKQEFSDEKYIDFKIYNYKKDTLNALETLKDLVEEQNSEIGNIWDRDYAANIMKYFKIEKALAESERQQSIMKLSILILSLVIVILLVIGIYNYRIRLLREEKNKFVSLADNLKDMLMARTLEMKQLKDEKKSNELEIEELKRVLESQSSQIDRLSEEIREKTLSSESQGEIHIMEEQLSDLKVQKNHLETVIEEYTGKLQAKESAYEKSRNGIRELIGTQFKYLDDLSMMYYENSDKKILQNRIYDDSISKIDQIKNNADFINKLESIINTYLDNLIADFRKDYPGFNEKEVDLLIFNILNFSPKTISMFQGIKPDQTYSRKSYLKRKIQNSDTQRKNEYLSFL